MDQSRRRQLFLLAVHPVSLLLILGTALLISDPSWHGLLLWSLGMLLFGSSIIAGALGVCGYHTPLTEGMTVKHLLDALHDPASLGLDDDAAAALRLFATNKSLMRSDANDTTPHPTSIHDISYQAARDTAVTYPDADTVSDEERDAWFAQREAERTQLVEAAKRVAQAGWLIPWKLSGNADREIEDQTLRLNYREIARRLRRRDQWRQAAERAGTRVPASSTPSAVSVAADLIEQTQQMHEQLEAWRSQTQHAAERAKAPYQEQLDELIEQTLTVQREQAKAAAPFEDALARLPIAKQVTRWIACMRELQWLQQTGESGLRVTGDFAMPTWDRDRTANLSIADMSVSVREHRLLRQQRWATFNGMVTIDKYDIRVTSQARSRAEALRLVVESAIEQLSEQQPTWTQPDLALDQQLTHTRP